MKKLINAVDNVVTDALRGMAAAHPHELDIDLDQHIVYRRRPKEQGKVAIISGGGSGHEPLHGGFVGTGMLDAACAGEIFTSPVPDQMVAATSAVDRGAGVLHIVKNYTGDVMNFEMAAEIVDAESGIQVASVVTNDDVAVEDSLYTAGRRGVGVTVMVEKIAGAAAEQGRPLDEVAGIAARVNAAGRSMGMALTSCTVPANGKPSFDLPEGGEVVTLADGTEYDLSGEWDKIDLYTSVSEALGEEITVETPREQLVAYAEKIGLEIDDYAVAGKVVEDIFEELVGNKLWAPTFVYDFPEDTSPLTRYHRSKPGLTEKWDLYVRGFETATAYSELADPVVQRERFEAQALAAAKGDPEAMILDEDFLVAMEQGFPPSGGMGMGIDRLLMVLTGQGIRETITFPLVKRG